jgi:hypothetical protein
MASAHEWIKRWRRAWPARRRALGLHLQYRLLDQRAFGWLFTAIVCAAASVGSLLMCMFALLGRPLAVGANTGACEGFFAGLSVFFCLLGAFLLRGWLRGAPLRQGPSARGARMVEGLAVVRRAAEANEIEAAADEGVAANPRRAPRPRGARRL